MNGPDTDSFHRPGRGNETIPREMTDPILRALTVGVADLILVSHQERFRS